VETDASPRLSLVQVELAEQVNEVEHFVVAPHPRRESRERFPIMRLVTLFVGDKIVNPVSIGPIRLDRDKIKVLLFDQCLGDLGSDTIELRRSVARSRV